MISNVMRTHDWSWQVVGITPNALEVYKRDHWRHKAGNAIQRAHVTDRKDMIRHIFDREIPMSESELLDYWIIGFQLTKLYSQQKVRIQTVYLPFGISLMLMVCSAIEARVLNSPFVMKENF